LLVFSLHTWCFCELGTEMLDSGFKRWIILSVFIFADFDIVLQDAGYSSLQFFGCIYFGQCRSTASYSYPRIFHEPSRALPYTEYRYITNYIHPLMIHKMSSKRNQCGLFFNWCRGVYIYIYLITACLG